MILPVVISLVFCALFLIPISSEAMVMPDSLSATFHDSEISLIFSDGIVSGSLTTDNNITNIDNIKVIEKKDRFFIFDKQNGLKIFSKQLSEEKYIIIVKLDSDKKLRFITDSDKKEKNIDQRNLFDAMNQKQAELENMESEKLSFKQKQLLEKEKRLAEALNTFEDRQNKIKEQEKETTPNSEKTREDILADFEKSKINTGMGLVEKNDTKEEKKTTKTSTTSTQDTKIKVFLSLPHSVEWKKELVYDIFVTDDSGHKYNSNYKDYVGNELEDVIVTGKITNPSDQTIHSYNDTADSNGNHIGRFLIPDNSPTRGEYTVSVNAVYQQKDGKKSESSTSDTFFVFPVKGNSFNDPPIANAGADGHYASGSTVTLDGSNSNDAENSPLSYRWTQTSGTTVTLDSNTTVNPMFTMLDEFGTFVFSLIVNDGSKDSLSPDTVTITSLHAEVGNNQTQAGVGLITLDGSQSGTALPNGNMTYSWTFLSVPSGSAINTDSLSDPSAVSPTFTPDIIGNYTLRLDASDDRISDSDVVNVEIT